MKTCPSIHLSTLESIGGISVTSNLKVEEAPGLSDSDNGIGRVRVRRKEQQTYHRVHGSERTFASRQRRYHDQKKQRFQEKFAIEVRRSSSLSSDHSLVNVPIDQRSWRGRSESWSDVSEKRRDVVIDFAKDSDGFSDNIISSGDDESSYEGIESDNELISVKQPLRRAVPQSIFKTTDSRPNEVDPSYETELTASVNRISASSSNREISQLPTLHHSSPNSSIFSENEEALYPFPAEESVGGGIWKRVIDLAHRFPKSSNRLPTSRLTVEPLHCPNTFTFIRKSLAQVGVSLDPDNTTVSATVGTTLTCAVAATAAAPMAVVGVAATHLAQRACDVLGVDNEVSRACQTMNRSARQLGRFKSDETDDEEDESKVMGNDRVDIRARPNHIIDSNLTPDLSYSVPIPPNKNIGGPPKVELSPNDLNQIAKKNILDPAVLRYRGIITRTADGHPCQSRIQLRFCRICKKYQVCIFILSLFFILLV